MIKFFGYCGYLLDGIAFLPTIQIIMAPRWLFTLWDDETGMTWDELFDRAARHATDVPTVREVLAERRDD